MAAVAATIQVKDSDRLGFSLFFATVLHAILILGLGFGVHFSHDSNRASMLEVTMVLAKAHKSPVESTHIASQNQLASGGSELTNQSSAPFIGASLLETEGIAPMRVSPNKTTLDENKQPQKLVLTRDTAESMVDVKDSLETQDLSQKPKQEVLATQELELARLVAEVSQQQQDYAKRPRINYIDTLSAKTATEASYVREWVDKVERIGNLNYPDEIRRRRLTGTLIFSVLLNHDGEVIRMEIQSSAGKSILDEAAKKIVRIAAPFKPFHQEMRDSYDQLMVTRTWLFGKNNTLLTK